MVAKGNPMTHKEILSRLETWAALQTALGAQMDTFCDLTGADPGSPLLAPVFALSDAYTDLMSEVVGDTDEWLNWYHYECSMGEEPKEAVLDHDHLLLVDSLRQLAVVIAWGS